MDQGTSYGKLFRLWLGLLVGWPALALLALVLFPPGWMLAIAVAFYFYAVPATAIGHPHFVSEFMYPATPTAFMAMAVFWLAAGASVAFAHWLWVKAWVRLLPPKVRVIGAPPPNQG